MRCRQERDSGLHEPQASHQVLQVNIRGGKLPLSEDGGCYCRYRSVFRAVGLIYIHSVELLLNKYKGVYVTGHTGWNCPDTFRQPAVNSPISLPEDYISRFLPRIHGCFDIFHPFYPQVGKRVTPSPVVIL